MVDKFPEARSGVPLRIGRIIDIEKSRKVRSCEGPIRVKNELRLNAMPIVRQPASRGIVQHPAPSEFRSGNASAALHPEGKTGNNKERRRPPLGETGCP